MNISNRIAQKHVFRFVSVLIIIWTSAYTTGCGSGKHFQQGARQSVNESPSQRAAISFIPTPNISVDSSIAENEEMANFMKPFSDSLNHSLSTTLAKIDSPFYNTFYTGNLGRLVADYMLLTATQYSMEHVGIPCHFAVANNGGLRAGLFPGSVTMRNVFEVMPFDNELVILQLSGGATDSLLRYIAQLTGTPVSGLLLEFEKADKPAKNRVVNAKINSKIISTPADMGYLHGPQEQYSGSGMPDSRRWPTNNQSSDGMNHSNNKINMSGSQLPFDSRRDYLVATSSYMAMGGDGFTMLKGAKQTIYTGIQLRDAIANGLKSEFDAFQWVAPR
ncbi:MAG: 5'-nucleotidase, partial [Bacteroidetes bacterium]|nr:5'-nucleotidase [Bacteroidota bacterium]